MSTCKKCGAEIVWKKRPDSTYFPPQNPDGSPHDCENKAKQAGSIIGRLESYATGSASFTLKGGIAKTYALTNNMLRDWQTAGFLMPADNHPEVWLGFTKDDKSFILSYHTESRPLWAAELSDPTNGEIKKPEFKKASELPKQDTPCTSPEGSPETEPEEHVEMGDEDRIRATMASMMPSDRVGCRISLAGMINSVIEIKKTHGVEIDTEKVKREAVALFLWCDGLTTQNIKRGD